MALLDVNASRRARMDSPVHHGAVRAWFAANSVGGWATRPVTEFAALADGRDVELLAA